MYLKILELPLLLLLMEFPRIVRMEEGELDPWTYSNCKWTGSTSALPTSEHTPRRLNLKKLVNFSPETWLMFSGNVYLKSEVGLTAGYLYSVNKKDPKNDTVYTFTTGGTSREYPAMFFDLDLMAYGFISCSEDEAAAMEEANIWWWKCPFSNITIILISLAALFVLVAIVATTIGLIRRRKRKREANLFPLSKRMRPKRIHVYDT